MTDNTIKFGDRVRISARYERKTSFPVKRKYKSYVSEPYEADKCIYIGRRTITNGTIEYDEYGPYWVAESWFQAGLVCLNQNENPIYVPLENIHRSET